MRGRVRRKWLPACLVPLHCGLNPALGSRIVVAAVLSPLVDSFLDDPLLEGQRD